MAKPFTLSKRDLEVIAGAEYYTVFRFNGVWNRDRREFSTLAKARADQGDDPKALVYAVMGNRDALIPKDFDMTAIVPHSYVPA